MRNPWTASEHGVPGEKVAVSGPAEVEPGHGVLRVRDRSGAAGALRWWVTSQGTEGWWGEVTSEQTRGSVGPERDSDLEEPGLQALVDTGRVCKGHSSRREAGQGSRGPGRVSQRTAITFCKMG